MKGHQFNRRSFIRRSAAFAAGIPLLLNQRSLELLAAPLAAGSTEPARGKGPSDAKVAIARCRGYGPEVRKALDECFDQLGGLGRLVKDKTVTVKVNLTGTDFTAFQGRSVGETYMTHCNTALALGAALFAAGARRVRFVESTNSRAELKATLALAGWDVKAFDGLGQVEFENTRNLGYAKRYAHLPVPSGGYVFSSFDLNHAYADTDVLVSLAKLKNHLTAGVTLSMKNMFGLTPNALYGTDAPNEEGTGGRTTMHFPQVYPQIKLPGLKEGKLSTDATWRIPRIVVDLCAACPVHLAILDGITTISGAEGPWGRNTATLMVVSPGVLIAGLNPVSTDAVGTAVMGCDQPDAPRGVKPFTRCDNHLLLAQQVGLGNAGLDQIELLGLALKEARYPFG
jgi:uncharacterized protein (DUF362 family)